MNNSSNHKKPISKGLRLNWVSKRDLKPVALTLDMTQGKMVEVKTYTLNKTSHFIVP